MTNNTFESKTKTSIGTKVSTQTKVLLGLMIVASIAGMFAIVGLGMSTKNKTAQTKKIQDTTVSQNTPTKLKDGDLVKINNEILGNVDNNTFYLTNDKYTISEDPNNSNTAIIKGEYGGWWISCDCRGTYAGACNLTLYENVAHCAGTCYCSLSIVGYGGTGHIDIAPGTH